METFSALLALCVGNSLANGKFPSQRPVTPSFDVFFDLHLNKRVNKESIIWWFETPLCSFWRHCYDYDDYYQFLVVEYDSIWDMEVQWFDLYD